MKQLKMRQHLAVPINIRLPHVAADNALARPSLLLSTAKHLHYQDKRESSWRAGFYQSVSQVREKKKQVDTIDQMKEMEAETLAEK